MGNQAAIHHSWRPPNWSQCPPYMRTAPSAITLLCQSDRVLIVPSTSVFPHSHPVSMAKKSEKVKAALKELSGKVYNLGVVGFAAKASFRRLPSSMDSSPSWCIWELSKRISRCTRWCFLSSEAYWFCIVSDVVYCSIVCWKGLYSFSFSIWLHELCSLFHSGERLSGVSMVVVWWCVEGIGRFWVGWMANAECVHFSTGECNEFVPFIPMLISRRYPIRAAGTSCTDWRIGAWNHSNKDEGSDCEMVKGED